MALYKWLNVINSNVVDWMHQSHIKTKGMWLCAHCTVIPLLLHVNDLYNEGEVSPRYRSRISWYLHQS
jgi:hypothetical protein